MKKLLILALVLGFASLAKGSYSLSFDGVSTVTIVGAGNGYASQTLMLLYGGVGTTVNPSLVYQQPGSSVVWNGANLDAWGAWAGWPAGYCTGVWTVVLNDTVSPFVNQNGTLVTSTIGIGTTKVALKGMGGAAGTGLLDMQEYVGIPEPPQDPENWTSTGGISLTYELHPTPTPPGPYVWPWSDDAADGIPGNGFTKYGYDILPIDGGLRHGKLEVDNSIGSYDAYIEQTIDPLPTDVNNDADLKRQFISYTQLINGAAGLWMEFIYDYGDDSNLHNITAIDNTKWQSTIMNIGPVGSTDRTALTVRIGILREEGVTTGTRSVLIDDAMLAIWPKHPVPPVNPQWENYLFDLRADWEENIVVLRPSANPLAVSENGPTETTYDIVLFDNYYGGGNWAPADDITVTVTPDSQTEINDTGAGVPVNFVFPAADCNELTSDCNEPPIVTVRAIDDVLAEGPHISTITHSASSLDVNYNQAIVEPLFIEIEDNDLKEVVVTVVNPPVNIAEEGETTGTYTLYLSTQPSADVTITATRSSDDVTLDVGGGPLAAVNLIFTTANYHTPQTITVKAIDDLLSEGPETVTITHVASGGDADYNALVIDSVQVAVADNEAYCGQPGQPYLDGDIGGENGCGDAYRDCHVDLFDFTCLAAEWLNCTDKFFAECEQWE